MLLELLIVLELLTTELELLTALELLLTMLLELLTAELELELLRDELLLWHGAHNGGKLTHGVTPSPILSCLLVLS
jgi:hypothetical protein